MKVSNEDLSFLRNALYRRPLFIISSVVDEKICKAGAPPVQRRFGNGRFASKILLEDTKEYISYAPKEETKAQDKRPFDLLVIISPKLQKKSNSRSSPLIEGSVEVQITLLNFSVIRR
uniref:Uncharacterized protein n=1 Tax=Cannabis sativa TaxID=3483 RepID=A0A803NWD1_CANSA